MTVARRSRRPRLEPLMIGELRASANRIADDILGMAGRVPERNRTDAICMIAAIVVRRLTAVDHYCAIRIGSAAVIAYADTLPPRVEAQP